MVNRGSANDVDDVANHSSRDGIQEHDVAQEFSSDLPSMAMSSSAPSGSPSHASSSLPSASKRNDHDGRDVAHAGSVSGNKTLEHALPSGPMQLPAGLGMVDSLGRPPVGFASNLDAAPGAFPVRSARNPATSRTFRSPIISYDSPREFTNEESKQEEVVTNSAAAGSGLYTVEAQRVPDGNEDGAVIVAEAEHLRTKWYQRRSITLGLVLFACLLVGTVVVMVVLFVQQPAAGTSSSLLTSSTPSPTSARPRAPTAPDPTTVPPTPKPTRAPPTPDPTAATISPVAVPTTSPVAPPTTSPVAPPTTSPVAPPTTPPVAPPTTPPVAPPTTSPVAPPTTSPVAPPTRSPVAAPTYRPVAAPTIRPSPPVPTRAPTARATPTRKPIAAPPSRAPTTWATPSTSKPTSLLTPLGIACKFLSIPNVTECRSTFEFGGATTGSTIPSEIGLLTQLTSLYFGGNSATDSMPIACSIFRPCNYPPLIDNALTSSIPSEFGLLTQLTYLSFYNNQLTSTIPSEIGLLTQLEWLDFRDNSLNGSMPSSLCSVPSLNGWLFIDCGEITCASGCCSILDYDIILPCG